MSVSFKPQNTKASATKRIIRDLRELEKHPLPGLGVCCLDESNPFILHCNVLINDGPYCGIMIHLVLHIPDDYPLTGPAGNIAPGLDFDQSYHGHIHNDFRNGHALCNDLLTNYAAHFNFVDNGQAKQASGWSPGYTLSTALLQIVTFFADPDLSDPVPTEKVARLREMVNNYQCKTCSHSYVHPNPPVADYSTIESVPKVENSSETTDEARTTEPKPEQISREIIEKLTCGVTKQNILEDDICLGYPLLIKRDQQRRLWPETVLELISYDAYVAEIQKSGEDKLDFYENHKFRSVTGKDYNHWLPIFINKVHFNKGRTIIENSISIMANGNAFGNARYDFQPMMALKVLTTLMNKSGVQLFNGEMYESKHAIEAYCHFLRLLMHFIDIYPQLDHTINNDIKDFTRHRQNRNKRNIPDIGEFLIQIALSKKYQFEDIQKYVYEEYFARQIYWTEQKHLVQNLFDIRSEDLPALFNAAKVSNHLLAFNLLMAQTFISPGTKERLDQAYGYPPDAVVEQFQQNLKTIKAIDQYNQLMKVIGLSNIRSSDDIIDFLIKSVETSNAQGYTRIRTRSEERQQRFSTATYDHDDSRYSHKRRKY